MTYEQIANHLVDVTNDPALSVDRKLLDQSNGTFEGYEDRKHIISMLSKVSHLLSTLLQDPSPVTSFTERVLRFNTISFNDILQIKPPIDFVAGLSSPSAPINLLTLNLLHTASSSESDVGIIAARPEIVSALLKTWLLTENTAVAEQALEVITAFIAAELGRPAAISESNGARPGVESSAQSLGRGLMMRRLTTDKDVYELFYSICSIQSAGQDGMPDKRGRTTAQARLMDFLKRFFLLRDFSSSHIKSIEQKYGAERGGLLEFAVIQMVDYEDDLLMHMTLIDFFKCLIGEQAVDLETIIPAEYQTTQRRQELLRLIVASGVHQRTMSYYLTPKSHDSLDATFLVGKSAEYIGIYAGNWPEDFLQSDLVDKVLSRICSAIEEVPPSQWARNDGPQHDLRLLTCLPRTCLLPRMEQENPLFLLRTEVPSADIFSTLSRVFHGPRRPNSRSGASDAMVPDHLSHADATAQQESAAARILYLCYLESNSNLWKDVIHATQAAALKENALAAIDLIQAVLEADWTLQRTKEPSSSHKFPLMPEEEVRRTCHLYGKQLPSQGVHALLMSPTLEVVFPYLMKPEPPPGKWDIESTAYKIATSKQDLLTSLQARLKAISESVDEKEAASWQELLHTLTSRTNQTRLSWRNNVGGQIATLER